jgi:hypothetical protein
MGFVIKRAILRVANFVDEITVSDGEDSSSTAM